jgi:hypothetical protein
MVEIGKIYKHFKGKTYRVLDIVKDSDNFEIDMVIYEQLEESEWPIGTKWARDIREFEGTVLVSKSVKRFEKID